MAAMGIRLATWNVNSLRQRLDHLARFAAEAEPDLICRQETKVTDAQFPRAAVRAMGYPHLLVHGQKGTNGVAIASRLPFAAEGTKVWCGRDDRRHAFVRLEDGENRITTEAQPVRRTTSAGGRHREPERITTKTRRTQRGLRRAKRANKRFFVASW